MVMAIKKLTAAEAQAALSLGSVLTKEATGIDYRLIGYEPGGRIILARLGSPELIAALQYLDLRSIQKPGNTKPMQETRKCSICGKPYHGYGNNAQPVNNGRCCDECNEDWVILARLAEQRETRKPE
jgi:hypothetical protein